jgi:hypothetical protein
LRSGCVSAFLTTSGKRKSEQSGNEERLFHW